MDLKRLFHVLVVGGSMLASKGCSKEGGNGKDAPDRALSDGGGEPLPMGSVDASNHEPPDAGSLATEAAVDAPSDADVAVDAPGDGAPDVGSMAEVAADADRAGAPCFCGTQPACCIGHGDAMSSPAPGIVCCWSTRCP